MKTTIIAATTALLFAAPAMAWEGKVVACYGKEWVPAKYETKHVFAKPGREAWEHRNGQLVHVKYAPVYKEVTTLVKDGYWLKVKEACK